MRLELREFAFREYVHRFRHELGEFRIMLVVRFAQLAFQQEPAMPGVGFPIWHPELFQPLVMPPDQPLHLVRIGAELSAHRLHQASWLIYTGRLEEAATMIDKIISKHKLSPDFFGFERRWLAVQQGNPEKAVEAVKNAGPRLLMKALHCVMLKRYDEAAEALSQRTSTNNDYLVFKNHRFWTPLRSDPRFQEMLAKKKGIYDEVRAKYGQYYSDFAVNND
jgi:hypothetical protein